MRAGVAVIAVKSGVSSDTATSLLKPKKSDAQVDPTESCIHGMQGLEPGHRAQTEIIG